MITLAGSHRTGKTTLARAYAQKHGLIFVETSGSAVFRELGLDPAKTYDFPTRLTVQERILDVFDEIYAKHVTDNSITDRSPLDMMAYTLAEAVGETVGASEQVRLKAYMAKCFEVINKRFSTIIVVQPGIDLVIEEGKAALNDAYIEHLNGLVLGLSVDERVKVPHFYLPRYMTNLAERLNAVEFAVGRVREKVNGEMAAYSLTLH